MGLQAGSHMLEEAWVGPILVQHLERRATRVTKGENTYIYIGDKRQEVKKSDQETHI